MTLGLVPGDAAGAGWPTAPACWEEAMSVSVRDRVGAATGAAFVALILIGNPMTNAGPAQNTGSAGEQLLRDAAYQASSAGVAAGVVLELLGFAAFICFLGYLADVLRRAAGARPGPLAAGAAVVSGAADRGILVCGSGAGVSVAACKVRGIRAATVHDTYTAHQCVEHDNVNVLCLGGRVIGVAVAAEVVEAFLGAEFSGEERHVRRLEKVDEIERTGGAIASVATQEEGSDR